VLSLPRLIALLTCNPARLLKLPGGTLREGEPADITILSPDTQVTIRTAELVSKSKNSPFDGWTLRGAVAATIVGGRVLYTNPNVPGTAALNPEP